MKVKRKMAQVWLCNALFMTQNHLKHKKKKLNRFMTQANGSYNISISYFVWLVIKIEKKKIKLKINERL